METLNQRIEKTLKDNAKVTVNDSNLSIERYYKKDAESMAKIADQHAIDFALWIGQSSPYNATNTLNEWMAIHMSNGIEIVTTEELLQIFKKETGC